ncbi:MAG: hypothetical protein K0R40_1061 [Burkholderiales bacterium]|jgi:hypothetical protein|nr:hypothetical protein [Burkholderiales bacterium]
MNESRLQRLMRLRGTVARRPLDAAEARDAAAATQRCLQCPNQRLCDEALAASDAKGLSLFCPNSHYVEYLRSRSLEFCAVKPA